VLVVTVATIWRSRENDSGNGLRSDTQGVFSETRYVRWLVEEAHTQIQQEGLIIVGVVFTGES
jgi:hypothetical protein